MDNLYILFDINEGTIVKVSSTEIENDNQFRQSTKLDQNILDQFKETNSIDRLFTDFKVSVKDNKVRLIDQRKATDDKMYNRLLSIPYIHKSQTAFADIKLEITSLENKPVLKVTLLADTDIRLNPYKNKTYVHLTDKNDVNFHYQTFDIDLNKFDKEIIYEIDRCDYRKLFANQISFYHRKKLNMVYTII